tara:strand:+ start:117 stop:422 length:306 start_codon:yes stop_codon:yes gene_type:complete
MSNERIDLTQFEGIAESPLGIVYPHDFMLKQLSEMLSLNPRATHSTMLGIAAVPKLITELKRCYEKLDNLKRLVTWNHTDSDNIAGDDDLLLVLTELLTSE